jgi:hypothetical protein
MIRKLTSKPIVLVLVALALVLAYVPVIAQQGEPGAVTTSDVGMVGIFSPAAGATVSGTVDITGTAQSNNFNYYKVEYSLDGENWISVVEDYAFKTQVADGVLASWDTTAVDNAAYFLRAVVVDNTGNFVASESVQVTVANEGAEVAEPEAEPEAAPEAEAPAEEPAAEEAPVAEEAAPAPAAPGALTVTERGTVGITSPAAGASISGTAEISGTAISNAFNYYKVEYSLDGEDWISVVEDYAFKTQVADDVLASWDTTAVADGAYMLRAVVVDNTGNFVASEPISVTVANAGEVAAEPEAAPEAEVPAEEPAAEEAPVAEAPAWLTVSDRGQVGISSPAAGDTVSGTVEISGTAVSNAFNYYKVEYSVDGTNWVSVAEDYAFKTQVADGVLASWDTTAVDNGTYSLRAVVVDNTGNFVASEPIQVTVAN